MARRDALSRAIIGIVYLPLYYLVLYPIVFVLGVLVTAVAVVWTFLTGRELERKPRATARAWESISQPVTWIFSGNERDKPSWVP